jgi:endogenous inhibitor of DNA gyrase (YacG/DUF329 family)
LDWPGRGIISAKPDSGSHLSKCPACGAPFAKKRKHQTFCSPKCRKAFWAKDRTARPGYDIRAQLDRIEKDLGTIKQALKDNAIEERP